MEHPTSSIEFPIGEIRGVAPMNPIPMTTLPNFHGISSEYPDTFLVEFDIVCRGYDYVADFQKLKIFLATVKGTTL